MIENFRVGQIVLDRDRSGLKAAAIVVGAAKKSDQVRICRWHGKALHWSLPTTIDTDRLEIITDWTVMPLTEAKRLSAAAYERSYLARAMESAKGSIVDAARIARIDRSNFRRLLERHGLTKAPTRKPVRKAKRKTVSKSKRSR